MKKILLSIIITLFATNIQASPDSLQTFFEKANSAYKANQYENAIKLYEKILNHGYESWQVYYNLANAYFREQNIPKAILNYERALKLNPSNEDIKSNLQYSKLFIKDEFDEIPDFFIDRIYKKIYTSLSSNTWAILSIIFFISTLILIIIFLFSHYASKRRTALYTSFVTISLTVIFMFFAHKMKNYFTVPNAAIIMQTSTMKSSPDNDGTDLYIINPGTKVKIKSQEDGWYEVKLPNGKTGWMKKQTMEVI